MTRYRKKPVLIHAFQWDGADPNMDEWPGWAWTAKSIAYDEIHGRLVIETLEGNMKVSPGDWIIMGVEGEIYPCKPMIFAKTYEPEEHGK